MSIEGTARRDDPQLAVQHHQRLADRGNDALGELAGFLQLGLRLLQRGRVGKRHHHPVDHVVRGPVGQHAHVVPAAVTGLDLHFLGHQRVQHLLGVLDQPVVFQIRGEVADRPSHVAGNQVDDLRRLGSEPLDAEVVVQEDRGDLGAVQQVLHVAVGLRQFLDLRLQLGVDRLHFFVERLQFLLGTGHFFVGALQFLVVRLQLLIGGAEFLLGGLHFFDGGLKALARAAEFFLHFGCRRARAGGRRLPLRGRLGLVGRRLPRTRPGTCPAGRPARQAA